MNIHSVSAKRAPRADMPQLLLDTAIELFAERTYEGTQVPAVAERAGVGVGSIYRHYPGKEALGNAAFQHAKGAMLDTLAQALAEGGPTASSREEFGRFWRGFARFAEARPAAFAFLEHQQHDTFLAPESQALTARVAALSADFIGRGQQRGEIRAGDAEQLVAMAVGAFAGLVKHLGPGGIARLSPDDLTRAEDAVWDLLDRKATR